MMIESIHEYERVQRERESAAAPVPDIDLSVSDAIAGIAFLFWGACVILLCVGLS